MDRIIYGASSVARDLPAELSERDIRRAVIVTGQTLHHKTELVERLRTIMGDRAVGVFAETRQHVPRSTVIALARFAREHEADSLVTLGGGTPQDTAKLAALCLATGCVTERELGELRMTFAPPQPPTIPSGPKTTVPHIVVPTTLSGGDFTPIAGSADPERRTKDIYSFDALMPKVVFLDPEFATATDATLWASTGMRAFDHAIEGICSARPIPIHDALGRHAIELLCHHLPIAAADPQDLEARGTCQIAAALAIYALPGNVPLGLSHSLVRQLGGRCGAPHGIASAIMLPAVLEFNLSVNEERQQLAAGAMAAAMGSSITRLSDLVRTMAERLGVSGRLRDWGVSHEDVAAIAEEAMTDWGVITNPRQVKSSSEIREILESVL